MISRLRCRDLSFCVSLWVIIREYDANLIGAQPSLMYTERNRANKFRIIPIYYKYLKKSHRFWINEKIPDGAEFKIRNCGRSEIIFKFSLCFLTNEMRVFSRVIMAQQI